MKFKKPINPLEGLPKETIAESPPIMCACPQCKREVTQDEQAANQDICPYCHHHFRLPARRRLALMCDEGSFAEHDAQLTGRDPLAFPDYAKKRDAARQNSGEQEGVVCGMATIGGHACALFAMDPMFMMGSMGSAVGEKITRIFEAATTASLPVIGFCLSGGARMQEGIYSLMQMAKTSAAAGRHSAAGLLYISVLCDPTTGGVTASFATLGDIILAEPNALIGFAGPRVIEQTIRKKLPEGFQRAETVLRQGFVDNIVDRRQLPATLGHLLALHAPKEVRHAAR